MIDLSKKLIVDIAPDMAETVEQFIDEVLNLSVNFYYKNVSYEIICWEGKRWAFQINAYQDVNGPTPQEIFFEGTKKGFIKALETLRLHDGTLFYDALTNPKLRNNWK